MSSPKPNQDDFKAPKQEEEATWRGDPSETYSDWTIEVIRNSAEDDSADGVLVEQEVAKDSKAKEKADGQDDAIDASAPSVGVTDTYHVHRLVLARGKRKSNYFSKIFRDHSQQKFNKSLSQTTSLNLDPLAAKAFPVVLDFMYLSEKSLPINTEIASALLYLARYLEVEDLRGKVANFIKRDLSMSTIDTYFKHAKIFCHDAVLRAISKFLKANLMRMSLDSSVLKEIDDLPIWIKAFDGFSGDEANHDKDQSHHASKLVNELGKIHLKSLDVASFEKLTHVDIIPHVHPSVALELCELKDKVYTQTTVDESTTTKSTPPQSVTKPELSSLEKRCAFALADTWKDIPLEEEATLEILKIRGQLFLVEFTMASLAQAKKDLKSHEEELCSAQTNMRSYKACLRSHRKPKFMSRMVGDRCVTYGFDGLRIGEGADSFTLPTTLPKKASN